MYKTKIGNYSVNGIEVSDSSILSSQISEEPRLASLVIRRGGNEEVKSNSILFLRLHLEVDCPQDNTPPFGF